MRSTFNLGLTMALVAGAVVLAASVHGGRTGAQADDGAPDPRLIALGQAAMCGNADAVGFLPHAAGDAVQARAFRAAERFEALRAAARAGDTDGDSRLASVGLAAKPAAQVQVLDVVGRIHLPAALSRAAIADGAAPTAPAPTSDPNLPTAPPELPTIVPEPPTAEPTAPPLPTPHDGPTYWRDAMPILRTECATCHVAGGIGPFPLASYEDAVAMAPAIREAVAAKRMPPLPPDVTRGLPVVDPRVMSDADRATLLAWLDDGAPEGDPADAPELPPVSDPYGPPDLSLDIGADYTPPAGVMDDYRCFVVDPGFRRDTELTMVDVVPTNHAMFHHGILYLALERDADAARQLDVDEPGPGYTCFGGPGVGTGEWVAAEAVGALRQPYVDGTAKVIPAGSVFILQLHYNTNNGRGQDRSRLEIWTAEQPVGRQPLDVRLVNFAFSIPPGAAEHTVTATSTVTRGQPRFGQTPEGNLWSVWGHMHVLGDRFALDLERADGSVQRLLDIPRWDFNWQGVYHLTQPVPVEAGDELLMTCTWDNTPANQPYVGGVQGPPRRVGWGEGTFDEMCLGGVTITRP